MKNCINLISAVPHARKEIAIQIRNPKKKPIPLEKKQSAKPSLFLVIFRTRKKSPKPKNPAIIVERGELVTKIPPKREKPIKMYE